MKKRLPRHYYLRPLAFLCLLGLGALMSANSVEAQDSITTAAQLLELKKGQLSTFVSAAEANARNCDALTGCSSSTCSRLSCYQYGTPRYKNYSCVAVANNTLCAEPLNAPACMDRNFDFTKGYLRRVDSIDEHISRTVCTQRSLDDYFINSSISTPDRFFRSFFGSVDGTLRIYPGADEPCGDSLYDPRIRPWYLEATSIPKAVTVVIDCGLNMHDLITGSNNEKYISKATATALRLLATLTDGIDYVSIVCFDGYGSKPLGPLAIYNEASMYQSFSDNLTAVVDSSSKSDPNSTHTNSALNAAIQGLTSSSIPATYLKVVIALIGGQQYEDIAGLNVAASTNVSTFVYSFRKPLQNQCNPTIRASLESIPGDRLNNPLYLLQSYYSFLAKLRISFTKNQTNFGLQYEDFTGIDTHTLTISKAAFGSNGELLGVMGVDFFETKVNRQFGPTIQFPSIVEEAQKHDPGKFDAAKDLTTNVCFNHTDACPALDTTNVQGSLCAMANTPDINIGCCGSCQGTPTTGGKSGHKSGIAIGGGIGGGIGGLLVLIGAVCLIRKCLRRLPDTSPVPEYKGPLENGDEMPGRGMTTGLNPRPLSLVPDY